MDDNTFATLREAARAVLGRAYAPYSRFPVAAAALVDDGRVVTGVNVENASYGLGLCAECGLVSALHSSGGGRLTYFTCLGPDGELLAPCGRCRQLLFEHGGPDLLLDAVPAPRRLSELLPDAFGPDDLDRAIPASTPGALPPALPAPATLPDGATTADVSSTPAASPPRTPA